MAPKNDAPQAPPTVAAKAKMTLRYVILKVVGLVLFLAFFSIALLFLGYTLVNGLSSTRGKEAAITSISSGQIGGCKVSSRWGGFYRVGVESEKVSHKDIYCLYPAWPDTLQPTLGDVINVWPAKQPRVGAPVVDGWGWFILGTLLIVGLVFLEFSFLSITLR